MNLWILNLLDEAPSFAWLTGPPGSGKSAILSSLCHQLKDSHILWAHYFINRNYISTLDPNAFFPTIAFQLAIHSPDVALLINETLTEKPSLVDVISIEQADALFINPLTFVAMELSPSEPIVIALDALDECNTKPKSLSQIATILSHAFTRLPNNVKVILSSRVESAIKSTFSCIACQRLQPIWQIDLETSKDTSIQDVELVIRREIKAIATDFQLDPMRWPGERQLKTLCEQASGLFIWAVTAVSFIREKLTVSITYRNSVVKQLLQDGMDDINKLYKAILDNMYPEHTDDLVLRNFRLTVGAIVVLSEPLSLSELAGLLENEELAITLDDDDAGDPVKMEEIIIHIVRQFRTVLVAGTEDVTMCTIPQLHKSFFEFVTGKQLDSRFRVQKTFANKELAPRCLRRFRSLRGPSNRHSAPDQPLLKYLHASISCYDTFLADDDAVMSMENGEKAQHFHFLALALSFRLDGTAIGVPDDLDRAFKTSVTAISFTPPEETNPDRLVIVDSLCDIFLSIFPYLRRYPETTLLSWESGFEEAILLIPNAHCKKPHVLSALGRWTMVSFHDLKHINQSIILQQNAIQLYDIHINSLSTNCQCGDATKLSAPQSDENLGSNILHTKSQFLQHLGSAMTGRFSLSSDRDDLNRSVSAFEEALLVLPADFVAERITLLLCLSQPLSLRIKADQRFDGPDLQRTLFLSQELLQSAGPSLLAVRRELQERSAEPGTFDPDLESYITLTANKAYQSSPACPTWIPGSIGSMVRRSEYLRALASTRNDHPDKPTMIALLSHFYPFLIKKKIAVLQLAILFLRKFGYSRRRTPGDLWKYSTTAQYNNRHPEEQENWMTRELLELVARKDYSLFIEHDMDLNVGHVEIRGNLDEDLFFQIVWEDIKSPFRFPWAAGNLLLADLSSVRRGPVLYEADEDVAALISEKDDLFSLLDTTAQPIILELSQLQAVSIGSLHSLPAPPNYTDGEQRNNEIHPPSLSPSDGAVSTRIISTITPVKPPLLLAALVVLFSALLLLLLR